jgi:phosphonopyruvate decarboxylase
VKTLLAELERRRLYLGETREDAALGVAAGAYLAGRLPAVVMQNSGLGVSLNALGSLHLLYRIPCLLLVTWRGFAGKDAPEHLVMGEVLPRVLELFRIRSAPRTPTRSRRASTGPRRPGDAPAGRAGRPPGLFTSPLRRARRPRARDPRGDGLHPRERLHRPRRARAPRPPRVLLHDRLDGARRLDRLGIALAEPRRRVLVLDGDGNVLMNLGTLATIAATRPANLLHVCFDNSAHASTGAQPTISDRVRLDEIARAAGYRSVARVESRDALAAEATAFLAREGPPSCSSASRSGRRDRPARASAYARGHDHAPSPCARGDVVILLNPGR